MPPSTLYSEQSRKPDLHPGEARKEGFMGHPFLFRLKSVAQAQTVFLTGVLSDV